MLLKMEIISSHREPENPQYFPFPKRQHKNCFAHFMNFEIKSFLNQYMYNHKKVLKNTNNGKKIIKDLFKHLLNYPKKYINKDLFKKEKKERLIADFISGMTDRYAINLHKKIK